MQFSGTRFAVYGALAGNLLVAVTKFVAALSTGSSAMLSEALHSVVDTGNEGLLLYGQHRAGKPADPEHPIGHARELYFWSFVVAVLIFGLGGGLSGYEGFEHIRDPEPISKPIVSFAVYGAALLFEGASWVIGFRNFRRMKGEAGYWEAVRKSKDPAALIVVFEDTAAILGIAVAAAGTALAVAWHDPVYDGAASIGVGLILAVTAALLARETKGLLIGETADRAARSAIREIACGHAAVKRVGDIVTVQLGPDEVVGAMTVEFDPEMSALALEHAVSDIESAIKRRDRRIVALFVKPAALGSG